MTKPVRIVCDRLSASDSAIVHGFYTRQGGVSTGIYRGLNAGLGSGDNKVAILQNRALITENLGFADAFLATPHQIHSSDALIVENPWEIGIRPKADGVVTDNPGIVIAILTADCGPILFADKKTGIIGACHAGWKGALSGIIENTISKMEELGADRENISAVLGPTISKDSYEVGPEFVQKFSEDDEDNDRFFSPSQNKDHSYFDLPEYIMSKLKQAEVEGEWTGHCTYLHDADFYSYRRTTHRGEP
ncbi:MAG: peptidoglycan editing factor PgeF, partial [Rhizobiaceae bacterium]